MHCLYQLFTQSQAAPNAGLNQTSLDCRPNLLFLNLDQLSHMALSCHGNPHVNTPNIDRLAKRSVDFSKSYTPDPICCPARASWATGRYPSETNVVINNRPLLSNLPDYGQWLGKNGYQTVHIGKWHVPGRPLHNSFQLVRIIPTHKASMVIILLHSPSKPFSQIEIPPDPSLPK